MNIRVPASGSGRGVAAKAGGADQAEDDHGQTHNDVVPVDQDVKLPFEIRFPDEDIGGPSAGLVYALAISDLLDKADYAAGRAVAATGAISLDGEVGPIGGVEQKAIAVSDAGADILLVPKSEVKEASGEGVPVRGVSRLDEALTFLRVSAWHRLLSVDGKILLVEDDVSVQETTTLLFERAGLQVVAEADGRQALKLFDSHEFGVVVLDLMLPSVDGLTVCREIRRVSRVPIVMLTALADPAQVVEGLECGADDYVTKPFNGPELVARVRAALRRAVLDEPGAVLRFGPLEIDSAACRVTDDGRPVDLSVTEFRLLLELAGHPDRVLSREDLVERVWGYAYLGDSRLVDMAVKRLRQKIGDDPRRPRYIATVRGVGYRFAGS